LVTLLPVLTPALSVRLPGDGRVSASFAADPTRREHHVDRAEYVLDAVTVMFDAPRVQQEARVRGSPPLGGLTNGALGDPGRFRRSRRRPLADARRDLVKADCVLFDKIVVEPVVLAHQVQNAVEQ